MKVKICQIGSGKVAKIRRQNYPENVKVVALLIRNVPKYLELVKTDETISKDVLVTDNLKQVYQKFGNNLIWDLVSDDATHLEYLKKILKVDPKAKIMLGKTPYTKNLISEFEKAAKAFPGAKITITENYAVSQVTAKVKALIEKYKLTPAKIILEFTKNRVKDIEQGRFLHKDIGVLGYEGAHMLTILATLDKNITHIVEANFEDLKTPKKEIFKNQGSAKILAKSGNCQIVLYTAMNGKVENKLPKARVVSDIGFGDEERFRVLIVEDGSKQIIGQYDPVPGLKVRPYGRIQVVIDGATVEKIDKIYDNTMYAILEQQICFLTDSGCPNPASLEMSKNFKVLAEVFKRFKN